MRVPYTITPGRARVTGNGHLLSAPIFWVGVSLAILGGLCFLSMVFNAGRYVGPPTAATSLATTTMVAPTSSGTAGTRDNPVYIRVPDVTSAIDAQTMSQIQVAQPPPKGSAEAVETPEQRTERFHQYLRDHPR